MKLLILTDGIAPFVIGGMQKHSFQLAKNLAILGHQITLVHCIYGTNKMPSKQDIEAAFGAEAMQNLEVISMRFPQPSWYPGHYVKESYVYSRLIFALLKNRLREFDFIYAKGFTAWHFIERKKKGEICPPIGIKFHGYEMLQPPANLRMRIHNLMLRGPVLWNTKNADYVFSYGGKITSIIRSTGLSSNRIIEIPTGIESVWITRSLPHSEDGKIRMVFLGRYERRKGIEELTSALRSIKSDNFEFHFIGPIPVSARIQSDHIIYHGSIQDKLEIQYILDKCQIIVVPSHSEGMPNVIMEGMSRGLAVIATDVGAVSSVVDSSNGWFVTPGDVNSLKSVILSITNDRTESVLVKQQASLSKVKEFVWEKIALQTARRIEELLK